MFAHLWLDAVFGLELQDDGSLAYVMRIVRRRTLREHLDETRTYYERGAPLPRHLRLHPRLRLFVGLRRTKLTWNPEGLIE